MYATIKFNRPVDLEKDYIAPGGYEMTMNGETVMFDFEESGVILDERDPSILHIEHKHPDRSYLKVNKCKITNAMIKKVEDIKEFFVFTGEKGETDLKPISVEHITFVLPDDGWKDVHVKGTVCQAAKVCSNID